MADDKNARDKQADDEERRQRERELQEARERGDEAEPADPEPADPESEERLGDLDGALEEHDYPTTADELIDAHGDREVETQDGSMTVDEVLAPVEDESYESPDDVRSRIRGQINR